MSAWGALIANVSELVYRAALPPRGVDNTLLPPAAPIHLSDCQAEENAQVIVTCA
jgi:hypothetical protein